MILDLSEEVTKSVLIIDDDEIQLTTLNDILELEGLHPITCRTGEQALQVCQDLRINVAILDLRLSDMDGLKVLTKLKLVNPEIKVIINTGYASLELALAAMNEEAFAYVRKMGDIDELISHVHRAFYVNVTSYNKMLESEVKKRTQDLLETNAALRNEINEREQIEADLAREHNLLRTLIDNIPDCIYVKDHNYRFVLSNKAQTLALGMKHPADLLGKTEADILPTSIAFQYQADDQTVMTKGEPVIHREDRLTDLAGKERWFLVSKVPLWDKQGNLTGLVVISRDITDQKQLEASLRQSQKMEAIGRLAGGVAHDFNNLLTAILGYSDLLLRKVQDNHEIRPGIEQIKQASEQAANLTSQLLTFSSQQLLKPTVLNLNLIITTMEQLLLRLIGEDIRLVTNLAPNLWSVKADSGQLEQVVMNLAINARDAMPDGGRLTIQTQMMTVSEDEARGQVGLVAGSYALLTVSDTGDGMDAETQARIFEPFFTTKEKGKGTGLGLATVHGIVTQNHGYIDVESIFGVGTTFKVYLKPTSEKLLFEPEIAPSAVPVPGQETILLVEDDQLVRDLSLQILREQGYQVIVATHGHEALEIFQQTETSPKLLVTDIIMPGGLNGYQLAQQLLSHNPQLRVLYLSGYTGDILTQNGISVSDIPFLQKPFTPEILTRKVREVLDVD